MPLDPQVKRIVDALPPNLLELMRTDPLAIRALAAGARGLAGDPVAAVEDRKLPGPDGEIPVRVYTPVGGGPHPALVFFHGGGWVLGDIDTHDATARKLANAAGCVLVSVDYRLAPEHPYPAAAEDCYAATRWVAERAAAIGADGSRLAVAGDSAGGNLAAVVSLMARDRGGPELAFQLLVYPITDCDFDTPSYRRNAEAYLLGREVMISFWERYVPDPERRREPYAAPLAAADLAGLPPALVITAESDPLRDEGEAYAARLEAAGVPVTCTRYDGMIHGFLSFADLVDKAQQAMAQAGDALRAALALPPRG